MSEKVPLTKKQEDLRYTTSWAATVSALYTFVILILNMLTWMDEFNSFSPQTAMWLIAGIAMFDFIHGFGVAGAAVWMEDKDYWSSCHFTHAMKVFIADVFSLTPIAVWVWHFKDTIGVPVFDVTPVEFIFFRLTLVWASLIGLAIVLFYFDYVYRCGRETWFMGVRRRVAGAVSVKGNASKKGVNSKIPKGKAPSPPEEDNQWA